MTTRNHSVDNVQAGDGDTDDGPEIGAARPVADLVTDDVVTLAASTTLREAAEALRRDDISFAAVGEGTAIEGVISERDLVEAIAAQLDVDTSTVADIESDSLKWAMASSSVADVAEEMLRTYVRHVLVCNDDGTLAGVVSMRDILSAYVA